VCDVPPFLPALRLQVEGANGNGIALESFSDIPGVAIPDHEHPIHFLNLLTHGEIEAQWDYGGTESQRGEQPRHNLFIASRYS
jgi:AraC family transcriptional regulator